MTSQRASISELSAQSIRQRIVSELQRRLGLTGREMTLIILERENLSAKLKEGVFERVREQVEILHKEGHVYATAQDDDLFIQLRKQAQA